MSLTDVAIRAAKPRAKPYMLSDEKGLFLIVKPNGNKFWLYKYTVNKKHRALASGRILKLDSRSPVTVEPMRED